MESHPVEETIRRIAARYFGEKGPFSPDLSIQDLGADGSSRLFFRIGGGGQARSVIIMLNPPVSQTATRENLAYLHIGMHLFSKAIPVPEIHLWDLDEGWFVMEDLGPTSLQDWVSRGEDPLPIYERVIQALFRLQIEGSRGFDPAWCWQTRRYDRIVMRQLEADYFSGMFLSRYMGLKASWPELEGPFEAIFQAASIGGSGFLMHRDFQSRNIMVAGGHVGFVDWQGARLGPMGYDLASLLLDPYAHLPRPLQSRLYQAYMSLVREDNPDWAGSLEQSFPYLAIQRNLQILGAFSFLSKVKGKTRFEAYIPRAVETLAERLHDLRDPALIALEETVCRARELLAAPR